MNVNERKEFANEAEKAIEHVIVKDVIEEQLLNLHVEHSNLARYGLMKIAAYAAQIARAQALGIDVQELTDRPLDNKEE